jgi:dsRNA-specific ribonuclease
MSPEDAKRIRQRFIIGSEMLNYQTLELYGDQVWNTFVVYFIMETNGLQTTPGRLTTITSYLKSNAVLTRISAELSVCQTVFEVDNYTFLPKHNICADNFEAILGVLWMQYGVRQMETIFQWLYQLPAVQKVLDEVRD